MLRSLDLFTGVGGITRALDGFATPVMYCERDADAVAVLTKLMGQRRIPRAPVHRDVATLDGKALRGKVDLIAAGFPCVGFSSSGKLEGFDNEQSSLYSHVVRLVREVDPDFVFLENVPGVLKLGLKHVVGTLGRQGYEMWWAVIPAWGLGAKHRRLRWFCLASKPAKLGTVLPAPAKRYQWYDWGKEPVPRLVLRRTPEVHARLGFMGNSVVPDCVRMAFMLLWTGCAVPVATLRRAAPLTLARPVATGRPGAEPPACGMATRSGSVSKIPEPQGLAGCPRLGIVLQPGAVKPDKPTRTTSEVLTKPVVLKQWGTPRHTSVFSLTLTERCKRDLGTQLRFAADTPNELRRGFTNPEWAEWLMGFPLGWTSFKAAAATAPPPAAAKKI